MTKERIIRSAIKKLRERESAEIKIFNSIEFPLGKDEHAQFKGFINGVQACVEILLGMY